MAEIDIVSKYLIQTHPADFALQWGVIYILTQFCKILFFLQLRAILDNFSAFLHLLCPYISLSIPE